MARALILALTLGLAASGPVMAGAQADADDLRLATQASRGISFPVISGWVMWRVRLADGDVTVTLNDRARVDAAMAEVAGRKACQALGRDFSASAAEKGQGAWTFRGACR